MNGVVKWFHVQKGYGFIKGDDGTDYFVHYSSIQTNGFKILTENQSVTFEAAETEKGPIAKKVEV